MVDEVAGTVAGRNAIQGGVLPQATLVPAFIGLNTTEIAELNHGRDAAEARMIGVAEAHVLTGATKEVTVRSGIGSAKVAKLLRVEVLAPGTRVGDARPAFGARTWGGGRPGSTLDVTSPS